jgi:glutamate--cysteine ligase
VPAPAPVLTVADVHRYVDEQVFGTSLRSEVSRVGIELEWITVARDGTAPCDPERLADRLPPLPGGSRLTFEPGAQLELSGPPAPLGRAIDAMRADTAMVRDALDAAGVDLLGVGVDIRGELARVLHQSRYRAMEEYFDTRWPAGRVMMRNTASVQVNVDLGAPDEVDARWHLAHDLGPVLTAAFANSPFDSRGRPSGCRSTRTNVWHAIDPCRTTSARRRPTSCARDDWSSYVLAAPVMMVRLDHQESRALRTPRTFGQWVRDGHELGWPTLDDLAYHTTTLFPPVRPRGWLELRMIDALPERWWPVAVAVTTALIDDPVAARGAAVAAAPVRDRWDVAARDALHDDLLADAARRCFDAALEALPRAGADTATVGATAEYAERYVARGRSPADDLLDQWSAHPKAAV